MMCKINKRILLSILILSISFFVGSAYSYAATATIQNGSGAVSTTVDVPINVTGVSGSITGVSIDVSYSTSVFSACEGVIIGTLTEGWNPTENVQDGRYRNGLWTIADSFSTDGTVIILRLTIKADAPSGNTTITLNTCTLNDDEPTHGNGTFTVLVPGEPTGTITLSPGTASIIADGSTTADISSTSIKDYAGNDVPDGTKITVATDAGTITSADADAGVAGIQVETSDGIISFTLQSATTTGTASITAESVAGDASGSTTVAFVAGSVSAAQSTVDVDSSSAQVGTDAGDGITVTVTLLDANDNAIEGTEVFLSVDGTGNNIGGTAGNGPTSIGSTNASGVATGVVQSTEAEAKTISATADSIDIAETQNVTFTSGPATSISVSGISNPIVAGVASDVVVTVTDEFGNVATGYTGTVSFTSTDSEAVLPDDYTFIGGDNGHHTFTDGVTLKTAGEQTVTATDGSLTNSQSGITVNSAAAVSMTIGGVTDPLTAGIASSVTVTLLDEFGNVATSYTGTIVFTSSDSEATLPSDYSFVSGDNGVHAFSGGVILKTAGEQSVTATDTVSGTITATQDDITVNPASPASLTVAGITDPVVAGTASDVTVTAIDEFGNIVTGYVGMVAFTSTDTQADLPANYTYTEADAGVHTFTGGVTLKTAGEQSVTVTAGSVVFGSQTEITVIPAVAAKIGLESDKEKVASGGKGEALLTATLYDQFDNKVADTGTAIAFAVTGDGVANAGWTSESADTTAGVATKIFTTTGLVPEPGTTSVTIKATNPDLGENNEDRVVVEIVNFSATPEYSNLVTSGTPHATTITAVGATNYTWSIVSGTGTLSATTGETITFTAAGTVANGTAGDETVIRVVDAADAQVSYDFTLKTYAPVQVTAPTQAVGITWNGDVTTYQITMSGGSGSYGFRVSNADGTVPLGFEIPIEVDATGLVTGLAAGIRKVYVWDSALGTLETDNSFRSVTADIEVVNKIVVVPATETVQASGTMQYGVSGGTAPNKTWSVCACNCRCHRCNRSFHGCSGNGKSDGCYHCHGCNLYQSDGNRRNRSIYASNNHKQTRRTAADRPR